MNLYIHVQSFTNWVYNRNIIQLISKKFVFLFYILRKEKLSISEVKNSDLLISQMAYLKYFEIKTN